MKTNLTSEETQRESMRDKPKGWLETELTAVRWHLAVLKELNQSRPKTISHLEEKEKSLKAMLDRD